MEVHRYRHHRYTYEEYVGLETYSEVKHEFLDGEIYAMAGGSEDHSALASQINRFLADAVDDKPCRSHTSDLRIYIQTANLTTYPDGSIVCGQLEKHPPGPEVTALNPSVLVEVTSPSSEEYDTGEKLEHYMTIPSVREIIIVSHRERKITVHQRVGSGWSSVVAHAGERVAVPSIGAELVVDNVYRKSSIA